MNIFQVPCLLFYVGLTVGEKERPQGDDLGGYCDHPCVRWGACIPWWQESELDMWRWRIRTDACMGCGVVRVREEPRMSWLLRWLPPLIPQIVSFPAKDNKKYFNFDMFSPCLHTFDQLVLPAISFLTWGRLAFKSQGPLCLFSHSILWPLLSRLSWDTWL